MYVTRRLSSVRNNGDSADVAAPEGPNWGYLVIEDRESESTCCFGQCEDPYIKEPPFPQNKNLTVRYSVNAGDTDMVSRTKIALIPVLNQPLSSNRYYVILRQGKHKGRAYTCSREEDRGTFCFCKYIRDAKPMPLDPRNIYHHIEISPTVGLCSSKGRFLANSAAADGFPPYFLRREPGSEIFTSKPRNSELAEAHGVDSTLRARLPSLDFPLSSHASASVVVGRWRCPFVFIKDGQVKDQLERSMYYEMTLEQQWQSVFQFGNDGRGGNCVEFDVSVPTESVLVRGSEAVRDEGNEGVVLFRSRGTGGEGTEVGMRVEIVERLLWEEKRVGWVGGTPDGVARIQRAEESDGRGGGWRRFGCYMLCETFVLRRMDGTLLLAYAFKHAHQIRSKWE